MTGSCSARAGERAAEARASAEAFLAERRRAPRSIVHGFRDAFMPYDGETVKEVFEELKRASTRSSCSRTRATTSTRTTGSRAS